VDCRKSSLEILRAREVTKRAEGTGTRKGGTVFQSVEGGGAPKRRKQSFRRRGFVSLLINEKKDMREKRFVGALGKRGEIRLLVPDR